MAAHSTTDDAQTLEDFAHGLSERQLHCRELGHNWRPLTATYDKSARVYDRRLRCPSCRTIRRQVLDSRGGIVANSYEYSKGYLAQNLSEHPGISVLRAAMRLESINRFMITHIEGAA